MTDAPRYPDSDDDTDVGADRTSSTPQGAGKTATDPEPVTADSRGGKLVIAGVAALVVVMVILHLTGVVGAGVH